MNYDPLRIRVYNKKFFAITAGCMLVCIPTFIEGFVPNYRGIFQGQKEFQDRIVIVTGATGNIGFSICKHYASAKFRVIMACRDMEKCKLLRRELVFMSRNNAISCRHLDLEDVDSINNFADDMIKNEPFINVLINNAAIKNSEERQLTKYGIERMYFVNFLAPFLLTFRLMDKLEKAADYAGESRIINILSKPKKDSKVTLSDINFDKRKYKSDAAYKQSKLALAYFTILLERYNMDKMNNVYVYAASPCFKSNRIESSVITPFTSMEGVHNQVKAWYTISANQAASTAAMCGITPKMANRDRSGKLYSFWMGFWGWGIANKDEDKAKQVWNHAYRTILNLSDATGSKDPNNQEKDDKNQVQQSNENATSKVVNQDDNKV